ncbi:unnamed protein product [Sphagnum troendelagicum]|uniref:Uncharacterized protein n=1 Tax=Sphagnum troendelagicum TaxID=128251 RepID=A0ABP0TSN9_9BRYO
MSLVTRFVPEPSLEERRAALIAASKLAWARGVTSEVDCGRFSPGETAQQAWDDLMALVEQRRSPGSRQLHVGGVKTFADGSLGSGSALFHDILTGFLNLSWKQTVLDIRLQFMPLEMQQMIKFSVRQIEHARHLSGVAPGHFGASGVIASVQEQTSAGLMSTPFIAAIY